MVDRIDMALDDIIKAGKKGGRGGGRKFDGNRKPGGGGRAVGGGGGFRSGARQQGGVLTGRNRGGISKPANYSRVNEIVT